MCWDPRKLATIATTVLNSQHYNQTVKTTSDLSVVQT